MPITKLLERNADKYPEDIALVELNPAVQDNLRRTWREYDLIQSTSPEPYRREINWQIFDEKANRFANMLLARGIKKGDKVAILLMNCLEWLPIYFGVLKTGALAVPLNFRYSSDEIEYCLNLSEADVLIFGPEFIGRVEEIAEKISKNRLLFFVGDACPTFAESYTLQVQNYSSRRPGIKLTDDDFGAIYFSSGTTGFPKAILHKHRSLVHAAKVEAKHHGQKKNDVFLCIPPLYHTGAKMHWFGSLVSGGTQIRNANGYLCGDGYVVRVAPEEPAGTGFRFWTKEKDDEAFAIQRLSDGKYLGGAFTWKSPHDMISIYDKPQYLFNLSENTITAIEEAVAEQPTVVATRYYSLDGRQVSGADKGIVVRVSTYTDGTVQVEKRLVK